MKKIPLLFIACLMLACSALVLAGSPLVSTGSALAQSVQDTVVVRFHETDELFTNPGKGFMTFQQFNGDTASALQGCCGDFRQDYPFPLNTDSDGNLVNIDYPQTSIAYFRFYWRFIEPEERQYRWDIIDRTLKTAQERGQTVILAIMSHGSPYDDRNDVPDWYREMVGEQREWAHDSPVNAWMVDPEDPRYNEYYGGMLRAFGERYDGHPALEAVDTRIVGAWGEGAGSELLSQTAREALINAYSDTFRKTPLIMLLTDEKTNTSGLSQADMGWRADCMGDLGFWADEQDGWTHMYDYYPQGIINFGMQNAWKKAPVSLEICGYFGTWKDREGYGLEEVNYIFDQGLKWHMSSFNAKSRPVPEEWMPAVEEWIRKMGYRFVLRRFSWPEEVAPGGRLEFTSWWENTGVTPIYRKHPLVLRLRNGDESRYLLTDVDIRDWMPGDNLYNDAVLIPYDVSPGEYQLEFALVEPLLEIGRAPEPAIGLPINAESDGGWYRLGTIRIAE